MAEALGMERVHIGDEIIPQEVEVKNLTTQATIDFIENERRPILILMRGIPGSGKSTIVEYLMKRLKTKCHCSADHYFSRNGKYNFDHSKLKEAHLACQDKAREFCQQRRKVVIIDNTNVKKWEAKNYVQLAQEHGYVVIMIVPQAQYTTSPRTLAQRNSHGVDMETIQQKLQMFEEYKPSYFAWFFGETATTDLFRMRDYCMNQVEQLGLLDFNMDTDAKTVTHMTSLHLSNVQNEFKAADITKKLSRHIGRVNSFQVTALVITRRTVSARVQVSKDAQKWYLNDGGPSHSRPQEYDELPKGHAAHITLSTAMGIKAEEAKSDMTLSHMCSKNLSQVRENIRYSSRDQLILIELNPTMRITGMFAACYSLHRHS